MATVPRAVATVPRAAVIVPRAVDTVPRAEAFPVLAAVALILDMVVAKHAAAVPPQPRCLVWFNK